VRAVDSGSLLFEWLGDQGFEQREQRPLIVA